MGLLICLSGAPWVGVEIDEVHRVGRALQDRVGDDGAWFEEWTRMGDRVAMRGRAALGDGHKLTAASCFLRASRYYQTGERFIHPRTPHSMEVYASAAYEYLANRPEFDDKRIGVMALSLGGYYAPRAASLESRFACCVAWGAQWDYHAIWAKRLDELASGKVLSLSVPPEHLQWVLGVDSQAAALKKLEAFRLDGIVQKMRCPFLLLHGEGDEQIPLALAQKCFEAVGSQRKTLKVFGREEGGFHHCQVDNVTIGVHAMWDWIEDVLKPG